MKRIITIFFLTYLISNIECDCDYNIMLSSNSPVIRGAVGKFKAEVFNCHDEPAEGSFKYEWSDNAVEVDTRKVETKSNVDTWNLTFSLNKYPPGAYNVQVVLSVKKFNLFYVEVASERIVMDITSTLNGQIVFMQGNKSLEEFVSNVAPLNQTIKLRDSDAEYIKKHATSIESYWFVDCKFVGMSDNLTFIRKYNNSNEKHNIETVVVVGYEPITTPAPSTTSTTPPNNVTTTAKVINATSLPAVEMLNKTKIESTKQEKRITQDDVMAKSYNYSFPSMCNNSIVPIGPNFTYGFFNSNITVLVPINNISVVGNNWLEHGDILSLKVKCSGSGLFNYCTHFLAGKYNITGNETCTVPDTSEKCDFPIRRYFNDAKIYTVVVVIYNDLGKTVYPIVVTVYEVTKQAQLSVIVIPVAFSSIAVILIVFGIAYYMQNRSRFTVEVADFDFGRNYSDMEYMTFKERLLDAVANAFSRVPSRSSSEDPVWPPGKYGSMT